MAQTIRSGALTVLQSAQTTASNGVVLSLANATEVLVELSGTPSGIVGNFEVSLDGSTWQAIALIQESSLTQTRVAAPTAIGAYRLESCRGYAAFRCRTSGTGGNLTAKAVAIDW